HEQLHEVVDREPEEAVDVAADEPVKRLLLRRGGAHAVRPGSTRSRGQASTSAPTRASPASSVTAVPGSDFAFGRYASATSPGRGERATLVTTSLSPPPSTHAPAGTGASVFSSAISWLTRPRLTARSTTSWPT